MPHIPESAFILAAFIIAGCFALARRQMNKPDNVSHIPGCDCENPYELVEDQETLDEILDSMDFDFGNARRKHPAVATLEPPPPAFFDQATAGV